MSNEDYLRACVLKLCPNYFIIADSVLKNYYAFPITSKSPFEVADFFIHYYVKGSDVMRKRFNLSIKGSGNLTVNAALSDVLTSSVIDEHFNVCLVDEVNLEGVYSSVIVTSVFSEELSKAVLDCKSKIDSLFI